MQKKVQKIKQKKIIKDILKEESNINKNIYHLFQDRVDNVKNTLLEFLKNIPPKDIMGYGASTKGNIVLNHLNLNKKIYLIYVTLTLTSLIDLHQALTLKLFQKMICVKKKSKIFTNFNLVI